MKTDWLIVGAGLTGAVLAERIATQLRQRVLLLDRRSHIAGNVYDCYDEHGILVHKYGPHIFRTGSTKVWEYLSQFTEWLPYHHRVLAVVEGMKVPVPFNLNSLRLVFPPIYAAKLEGILLERYKLGSRVPIVSLLEDSTGDLRVLAEYVYENIVHNYTLKQWGLGPSDLDGSVISQVPFAMTRDDRYFQDRYQGIPKHGYTEMFYRMLKLPNVQIVLQADYRDLQGSVEYGRMVYTGAIDEFFGFTHGPLPYRSLHFDFVTKDVEFYQEVGTVNYPNDYDFTRITEQKHITGQAHRKTTLVVEYPRPYSYGVNEPFYPIPRAENRARYELYIEEARSLKGRVLFAGRLGDYKYYSMHQAVGRALELVEDELMP